MIKQQKTAYSTVTFTGAVPTAEAVGISVATNLVYFPVSVAGVSLTLEAGSAYQVQLQLVFAYGLDLAEIATVITAALQAMPGCSCGGTLLEDTP